MENIITTDDLCLEYLDNFTLFDGLKKLYPDFKMIAFTIGNFKNKENLKKSKKFREWYNERKDWVEIAVHSYDHDEIPDGDREYEKEWIKKGLDSLKEFLPKEYGYRSPGWQTTNKTEGILKDLGFSYIAYETKIKYFNGEIINNIINSHLYDVKSVKNIYEILQNNIG
jgi:predicted deacetylase